jgi:16S rRNA (adenine1518-N6/adenine1519-N6)-dimethyltransferase
MKAKKSLGQHFLTSQKAIHDIVKAGSLSPGDVVIEIGPGTGVLTKALLESQVKVVAIEKDDDLIEPLREKFHEYIDKGFFTLIHGDITTIDISTLVTQPYKVIANIPYYITGEIIRLFLECTAKPERMVFLVQKEVASRIVSKDNKESILSLSVKVFGDPVYISTVKAGSFNPPPKVDSAIIQIITHNKYVHIDTTSFFNLIKHGFSHKRKKLISNLTPLYNKDALARAFERLSLSPIVRSEDLTLDTWVALLTELM